MSAKRSVETCFNYCDSKEAFFSSDEQKWINRIRKYAKQYPSDCIILKQPEENDGCIYCKLPSSWLKIQPKVKREYTEEELEVLRQRVIKAQQARLAAAEV